MSRVAVCLIDRANYGRLLPVMEALRDDGQVELTILVGGTMLLDRFGHTWETVQKAFWIDGKVWCEYEGNTTGTMARSTASAITGFVDQFERLKPDAAIIIGDRHEALGAAIAARYTGTTLVHFQGGERSGCIDDDNRDAITAMAQYHVPATEEAAARVRLLDPRGTILTVGCPSSDLAREVTPNLNSHILACLHPDTNLDAWCVAEQADMMLGYLDQQSLPTILLWPNIDAGSDAISKRIRQWLHQRERPWLRVAKNLEPREYMQALADAIVCIGNSSAFVRDSTFFGTPVLLIGERQQGRSTGVNVWPFPQYTTAPRSKPSDMYGDGHVSERFVVALKGVMA